MESFFFSTGRARNGLARGLAASLAIAASSALAAPPVAPAVDITKFAFTPADITVAPGTTITWTNHDEVPHTVATTDKRIVSKALDTNDTFQQTFGQEGDFPYYCTVHPFMTGVVHVRKP